MKTKMIFVIALYGTVAATFAARGYYSHNSIMETPAFGTETQALQVGLELEKMISNGVLGKPANCDSKNGILWKKNHVEIKKIYVNAEEKFKALVNYEYTCQAKSPEKTPGGMGGM